MSTTLDGQVNACSHAAEPDPDQRARELIDKYLSGDLPLSGLQWELDDQRARKARILGLAILNYAEARTRLIKAVDGSAGREVMAALETFGLEGPRR